VTSVVTLCRAALRSHFARTVCSLFELACSRRRRDSGLELDARSKSSHVGSLRSNSMLAQRARMFSPPPPRFWTRTVCSLF